MIFARIVFPFSKLALAEEIGFVPSWPNEWRAKGEAGRSNACCAAYRRFESAL
jgi:hypothetical protein